MFEKLFRKNQKPYNPDRLQAHMDKMDSLVDPGNAVHYALIGAATAGVIAGAGTDKTPEPEKRPVIQEQHMTKGEVRAMQEAGPGGVTVAAHPEAGHATVTIPHGKPEKEHLKPASGENPHS